MPQDLEKALEILKRDGCTCVACCGGTVYTAHSRGVRPLLTWLDEGNNLQGFSCADRVVGKGAAILYCLLGVRRVHGLVMSVTAAETLKAAGIEATWELLAEGIRNRAGDGPCPIEQACLPYESPRKALSVIRQTLEALQK